MSKILFHWRLKQGKKIIILFGKKERNNLSNDVETITNSHK